MKRLLSVLTALAVFSIMNAADTFVKFAPSDGALPLAGATISVNDNDYEAVKIAAENLKADMQRVGLAVGGGTTKIIIGTIGKNPDIDRLKLKNLKGKREMFVITTTQHPTPITQHPTPNTQHPTPFTPPSHRCRRGA